MKKCIHLITGLENGGAESLLYRLVTTSANGEFQHIIISMTSMGFYGNELLSKNIECVALGMPRGRIKLKALWQLYKLIKKHKPSFIQCWMYHANLLGSLMKILIPSAKVIWGIHNNDLNLNRNNRVTVLIAKLSAIFSYFAVAKIIYCSQSARDAHEKIGYARKKGVVIVNGTDLTFFNPNLELRKEVRKEWGILENEFVIGMVARWDKQKNHISLIEAFSRLVKREENCKLVLCGQSMNKENSELASLIERFNVSSKVVLVGETKNVNKIYNGLDIHILPSLGEAFGNVTIEAMACKIPCIMSDVGAGREIIGADGWIINNVSALRIEETLVMAKKNSMNEESWKQLKERCRKNVESNFSIIKMNQRYFNAWEVRNE